MQKVSLFKQGQKATLIAAGTTIFFAIAKAVAGIMSGSIVLIGDAIHSAADSFSAFFAWIGLKIAQKKPTKKFPYGFYKAENIAALLISFLILFAGYEIIKESVNKLFVSSTLNIPLIAIGVALLDAIIMFFIGSYEVKTGKKINSQSLIADGRESKMHLFSSFIVLIGLVSSWLKISYLESVMGILISLFIFQIGISSIKDAILSLMDVSPSKEIEQKIKRILNNISGIKGFENLKLRRAGMFIFGEVKVEIARSIDIKRANEISNIIENEVKKKVKSIDVFTVSFTPFSSKQQKIAIPVDEDNKLESSALLSEHFGRAKKFIFLEIDNKKIKNQYIKNNPYCQKELRAGLNTALFIIKEKVNSVITKEIGSISLHTLRDNIVDVYITKENNIKKLVDKFLNQKLEPSKEPSKQKR